VQSLATSPTFFNTLLQTMVWWFLFFTWPIIAWFVLVFGSYYFAEVDWWTYLWTKRVPGFYKDKVVWITGASSGIGKAIAIEAATRGACLIISSRKKHVLEELKKSTLDPLAKDSNRVKVLPLDLNELKTLKAAGEAALKLFGHVDVLVNNAGMSMRSLAHECDFFDVDVPICTVDYLGQVALTKSILKSMMDRQSGLFINISSTAGKTGFALRSAYCGAKWALLGYFESIRTEMSPYNVGVCNVCPGFVQTNVARNALLKNGEAFGKEDADIASGIPSDRAANLILDAASCGIGETWIARGRTLYSMYLYHYTQTLGQKYAANGFVNYLKKFNSQKTK